MRKKILILLGQLDVFGIHLDEFRLNYFSTYKLVNKGNGRYEYWHNDSLTLEILALPIEKDYLDRNQLEVQVICRLENNVEIYEMFCDWIGRKYKRQ